MYDGAVIQNLTANGINRVLLSFGWSIEMQGFIGPSFFACGESFCAIKCEKSICAPRCKKNHIV